MTEELLSRVFELFAQAERTPDRSQGGLGLGLALVKSLTELHAGTVEARSAGPGQGSCFIVRLPSITLQSEVALPKEDAGKVTRPAKSVRILVVDDNVDAAHTLEQLFSAAGHAVQVAYRALDAMIGARAMSPHVFVLDIGLPDFDGNELARRLRATSEAANAVLIAISGYGRTEDRRKSMDAGFDYYFVKPVDGNMLLRLLGELNERSADSSGYSQSPMSRLNK